MRKRFWITPLLFGLSALLAGAGCGSNPIILLAYILDPDEAKMKANFPLKPQPKHEKEEVKVMVLVSCVPDASSEMIGVDRTLAAEFIPLLEQRCTDNKETVLVLKSQVVDKYKNEHPDWRSRSPYDIGKHLKADYVIEIEVLKLGIYEPLTHRQIFKGRSSVRVAVYDMSKTFKEPVYNPPDIPFEYPRGSLVDAADDTPNAFRQKFIKQMAKQLTIEFTAHTADQKVNLE